MVKHTTPWQLGLEVVTAALALAAVYTTMLISDRQQSLIESSGYNTVFDASQAATELMRFESQVGRYAVEPSAALLSDVQLRFAIIESRINLLHEGEIGTLIQADVPSRDTLTRLSSSIATIEPLVDNLDHAGNPRKILDTLAALDKPTVMLVSAANQIASVGREQQRQHLRGVYWNGLYLTIGLIVCGFILVVMLMRRNRSIYHLAHCDHLTGLPNRLAFQARLADLVRAADGAGRPVVMLLDIDLFKHINDALGHAAGDGLLRVLATRLKQLPGGIESVSRLGGDEFAVLLSSSDPTTVAADIAQRICRIATEPFDLDGKSISTSLSVGIVVAPPGCRDPQVLLKNADVALYAAKSAGRGTYRFFDPRMERDLQERRDLEADLRAAIRDGELELQFQPIVDLSTRAIVNCEALARWRHPRYGLISPSRFIPIAEESGLIAQIGEWVIGSAFAAARSWPASVRVSVNLSPCQFDGTDLLDTVRDALAASGLSADRVELEITESVLMRDNEHVLRILAGLKTLGIRIALDDFGTGYSSLGYLQRFPIDKIKVDQSFVRQMTMKPDCALIVESIGMLARKLGLTTTAEGVETEAHADLIRAMGYAEGQGYYFAMPLATEECGRRLWAQQNQASRTLQVAASA